MAEPNRAGRENARKLVEGIRDDHGYVPPEIFEGMEQHKQQVIQRALQKKDEQAGWSITTLAKNIYSSNARFVFELLQNCDDNSYSKALSRNEDPYVSFELHPDRIVMTSNEDGFTEDNLHAICSVGKSSKIGAQGYIGEKGIGFKSVFMAAYKVVIQSGNFCFYFQHRKGDLDLGMITPIWQIHDDQLSDELSRFTLYLHEDAQAEDTHTGTGETSNRQRLHDQFRNIHDDILLFMKNLKQIKVKFYDEDGSEELSMVHSITWSSESEVVVQKKIEGRETANSTAVRYLVVRHTATDLSPNENRTYSMEEKTTKAYSKSEIVLAFPVKSDSTPRLDNQWVFAFLPVRQMGFKFLIHADFVTEASRQDIVTTSTRNKGLVAGIADAFIKAVLHFSNHDTLQWLWMRYIPQKDAYAWDGFWHAVLDEIGDRLQRHRILRLACSPKLELLADCMRPHPRALDKGGEHLLPDQFGEYCVDLRYKESDLRLLTPYGLQDPRLHRFVQSVSQDLSSKSSKYRASEDDDWHSRFAKLLLLPFEQKWAEGQIQVKRLPIIPVLCTKQPWVSTESGPLFFPDVTSNSQKLPPNLSIPDGTGLLVVRPAAVKNATRRLLFGAMGVQTATAKFVRSAIINRNTQDTVAKSRFCPPSHLHFLYSTQGVTGALVPYNKIPLMMADDGKKDHTGDFYIRSLPGTEDDEPYEPSQLLKATEPEPGLGAGLFQCHVSFLSDSYFNQVPAPPPGSTLTLKDWLHICFRVPRYPRLVEAKGRELSMIAKYVAKWKPQKFIGYVQKVWWTDVEPLPSEQRANIIEQILDTLVPCEGGQKLRLQDTFLPSKELKRLCGRFLLSDEVYPWVLLQEQFDEDTIPLEWAPVNEALWHQDNGPEELNVRFTLTVLSTLTRKYKDPSGLPNPQRIPKIYIYLQAELRKSESPHRCRDLIQEFFEEHDLIFVPQCQFGDSAWIMPSACVWNSPMIMDSKYCLATIYENVFEDFADDKVPLADFFQSTLGISDSGCDDLVGEIEDMNLDATDVWVKASQIYHCLAKEALDAREMQELRTMFQMYPLIVGLDGVTTKLFKSSECLWSSAIKIGGMFTLDERYSDLEEFFVKKLGVQRMTPKMIYQKLLDETLSVADASQTILAFNSFLGHTQEDFEAQPIREKKILPASLPDGQVKLLKCTDDFAILDRQSLGDDFKGKAKILNFTIDEVRSLGPFFAWLDLEGQYLSRLVKETTSVDIVSTSHITKPHRKISHKAHALLSIALAYSSPRARQDPAAFHALLKGSETFQTDNITSIVELRQDNEGLKVEKSTATLHIEHIEPNTLKIYVPKNEVGQDFCFSSKLPQQLCGWMMMTHHSTGSLRPVPAKAVSAVQSVLNVANSALPDVLDFHGIKPADPVLNGDIVDEDDGSEDSELTESLAHHMNGFSGASISDSAVSPIRRPISRGKDLRKDSRNDPVDAELFRTLLHRVVIAARGMEFPSCGLYDSSGLLASLSGVNLNRSGPNPLGSAVGQERDLHVGAAGELFVFELLSHLKPSLPGFGRENWQSGIRHYIQPHPDYQDISSWRGIETTDLVYSDEAGILTALLIDKGYLKEDASRGTKTKYFIEVKTSTGPCEMPFFMEPSQYAHMQRISGNNRSTGQRANEMYIIFRVFNLGRENCGVRVLVDPETLRQQNKLQFKADPWIVTTK